MLLTTHSSWLIEFLKMACPLVSVSKPSIGTLSVGVSTEVLATRLLGTECFPFWFVCKENDAFIAVHLVLNSTELSSVSFLTARCPKSTRCLQSLFLVHFTLSGLRQMPETAQWVNGVFLTQTQCCKHLPTFSLSLPWAGANWPLKSPYPIPGNF